MGDFQRRNLTAVRAFYGAGPAATDEERRTFFAPDFVWHVPGDTDLSGPYVGDAFFTDMPARMQPLENWSVDIEHFAANEDLVVAAGRIRGRRLARVIECRRRTPFSGSTPTLDVAGASDGAPVMSQLDTFFA